MLLPALADGQVGMVVDAKLKSKQFLESRAADGGVDAHGRAGPGLRRQQSGVARQGVRCSIGKSSTA